MTVREKIESRIAKLKPTQQRALLTFLDSLEMSAGSKPLRSRKKRPSKAEIKAAIRGVAGMWKDRTDLPKDSVEAVKVLRSRMWSRGRNG